MPKKLEAEYTQISAFSCRQQELQATQEELDLWLHQVHTHVQHRKIHCPSAQKALWSNVSYFSSSNLLPVSISSRSRKRDSRISNHSFISLTLGRQLRHFTSKCLFERHHCGQWGDKKLQALTILGSTNWRKGTCSMHLFQ